MALEASNVRVGNDGRVWSAPLGTALPTTADEALDAAFVDFGYVTEDGVGETPSVDINEIKGWQKGAVVRKVQTKHDIAYDITFLESNAAVLEAYYGNYTAGVTEISGDESPHKVWVIDVIDDDKLVRLVLPDGQITDRGAVSYQNGEAIAYPVTVTAYPVDGVKVYRIDETAV